MNRFEEVSISSIRGIASIFRLQFENMVLANRQYIFDALGIKRQNIIADNPYLQRR